ncbi:zinc-binding dehydrogenase [Nocardiopsis ganjiahuensis]|uniref:zinc-binding dehydrogenase n=1 Tax=Nocardiopsis ganjiahuensis TaxID=239984 RepID=UPI000346A391|nr:zinc-binding dehydrogenase [Nocardiopsis ganjiahuensis]
MRALVVDHAAPGGVRLSAVEDPEPARDEALVRVRAVSVNFGEAVGGIDEADDGTVLGWDAAGIVERAAADGSGPAVGTPVISLGAAGAWAELRAVRADTLAVAPPGTDPGALAALPVAGFTALRALHEAGPILGRRVLVTGASGGVGRFTVQLARLGGAHVTALTSGVDTHGAELRSLGAHDVVGEPRDVLHRVDAVIDLVGGATLVDSFEQLADNGVLVAVGHAAGLPERFPHGSLFGTPDRPRRRLVTFHTAGQGNPAGDLGWLARQVHDGLLDPQIAWRGPWAAAGEVIEGLRERRIHGKAVLDVG